MNGKRVALWGGLITVAGGALAAGAVARARRVAAHAPEVVPFVDIRRYLGKWFEVARYPTWFEPDDCVATTAIYSLRPDGRINVVNECHARDGSGPTKTARGVARVADEASNAKLKVTFRWLFTGDYWIVDLDPDYQLAAVSDPARKNLWILSRTRAITPDAYENILNRLHAKGFDTEKLIRRQFKVE